MRLILSEKYFKTNALTPETPEAYSGAGCALRAPVSPPGYPAAVRTRPERHTHYSNTPSFLHTLMRSKFIDACECVSTVPDAQVADTAFEIACFAEGEYQCRLIVHFLPFGIDFGVCAVGIVVDEISFLFIRDDVERTRF